MLVTLNFIFLNDLGTHKERKIDHQRVFLVYSSAHFDPAQGLRAQGNSHSCHG